MGFENMKKLVSGNASMDKKSSLVVKSIPRTYRIDMDIAEALNDSDLNKNKLVNRILREELIKMGLLHDES